tara:strand:+ start:1276 stop:2076 length:801 start_codon:yes stop_codon:yes gene_type:complete
MGSILKNSHCIKNDSIDLKEIYRLFNYFFILLFLYFFSSSRAYSVQLDLEFGKVKLLKNKIQIPATTGTIFDTTEVSPTEDYFYRVNLYWPLQGKHSLKVLYAPLEINQSGKFSKDITYEGEVFSKSNTTNVLYKFNSYRLTYRYQWMDGSILKTYIGFTGKIRDAETKLSQSGLSKSYSNVGFVPLIYLRADWSPLNWLTFILEMDALGASQGRAIEGAFKTRLTMSNSLGASLGHRVLEGGADNDKLYTWSLISFTFVSLDWTF